MTTNPPIFPDDPNFVFLDDEERELVEMWEEAFEKGEVVSILTPERKAAWKAWASSVHGADRETVSIKFNTEDLSQIRSIAKSHKIPYQRFIQNVMHDFIANFKQ